MLLERDSSLAELTRYAAEARRGDGRLVLVAGEAGVGKTALVERLQESLRSARWSWSACDGLFTPGPLGPLLDLAHRFGGPLLERCRAGADREDLFRTLLETLSEPHGLDVVVVEDVHWADEATLDLLRFLGKRLRGVAALVIVTYRDDRPAVADPLQLTLGDLTTLGPTRRIGLAPLSAEAVRTLAADSGLDSAALYQLTGGNPFFVREVLVAGLETVPASARDAVLARAARTGAREVLEVAALIGSRVEPETLTEVAECGPAAVDELLAHGLLVDDGRWMRFRHEIARLAVEQAIGPHRRTAIHRRIYAALTASGGVDDARLAYHAEEAGDGPAVLRHAPAAAERAARMASHRPAAAQLERALRFAAEADPRVVADLYDRLADEQALVDRWDAATSAAEEALARWRALGDRRREGDSLRRLSRIRWNQCRGGEAFNAAGAAIAVLEDLGPTVELARAYATAANQRMLHADYDAATAFAVRAEAVATALDRPDVLSDALNTRAVCVSVRNGDWTGLMDRALAIALSAGQHEQAARAFYNRYAIHITHRRYAEADRHFAAASAHADEHDLASYTIGLRGERCTVLERTGRWDEAVALGLELLVEAGGAPASQQCALRKVATIRARRAAPGVWDYLDEATATAERSGEPQNLVPVRLARAEVRWLRSDPAAARREAELAADVVESRDPWERGEVAVWLRRTGSTRTVTGDVAGPYTLELAGAWVEAAARWTELGCPYPAALALADAPDVEALRSSLRILTDLGAVATARVVRHKLRRLGARSIPAGPRAATRADPAGLTGREREVLLLLCAAHTNAEIASKLFVSRKTVDHHVSAVLTKLGVPSRFAAARRAAELGLL